ncbi:hypothetical protein BKA62DRAFT_803988 [Auriculariales sp. MPI-PUGE-AT-0066]|nr:hypothetical protein BKA62DRAFT_803988 [Auriculariales sp. MPI-PUGE-AT-0066]
MRGINDLRQTGPVARFSYPNAFEVLNPALHLSHSRPQPTSSTSFHALCMMYARIASRLPARAAVFVQRRTLTRTSPLSLAEQYSKADAGTSEVFTRHCGTPTYVVSSTPDADAAFDVPAGAFTSQSIAADLGPAADAPPQRPHSSTSSSPAHPTTTRQATNGTLASRNSPPTGQKGSVNRH